MVKILKTIYEEESVKSGQKKMTKYSPGNKDSHGHSILIRNYGDRKAVEQHRKVLKEKELKALEIVNI